jgi:pyrimidine operon attenuation protein/uracil phosphoribosyltransferase
MAVAGTRNAVLDARGVERALRRMAAEIVAFAGGVDHLVLVGIHRRGPELVERLARLIEASHPGVSIPRGTLDITLYRDDLETVGPKPVVGRTHLPPDLEGRCVVIVDDVLYTGRTVRAALDELADFGRPARIGLAALIDRGGRELPIQADIVGHRVQAEPGDRVDVLLAEVDGRDAVELVRGPGAEPR